MTNCRGERETVSGRRARRTGRGALLASAAFAVCAVLPAAAEEAVAEDEQREETITVYGTSNPLPVFDYPGQVTVISS